MDSEGKRLQDNLQGEIDSAALYRAIANAETNPQLKTVYRRLAEVEDKHATFWQARLRSAGLAPMARGPGARARLFAWLARRFGTNFVLPSLVSLEKADSAQYDTQADAVDRQLPGAERSHARVLDAIAGATPAALGGGALARLEGRHRGLAGNSLRAAILGSNDGLVSNLSLVMGIAGAAVNNKAILLTGLAGLVAGACSMAMGEWISVNSSRELYQRQIAAEREELENVPDEEREELILIYQAKGLSRPQAESMVDTIMADSTRTLDTLAREELGIDPNELGGSPWSAAGVSFLLFSAGAIIPVLPLAVLNGREAILGSVALAGAALFGIGAATTLFTGRGAWFSGFRQLAIGLGAAAITYGIGSLFGVSLN